MTLITSISGIRGTIGGKIGEGLSPFDITKFVSSYSMFIKQQYNEKQIKIVIGRDARISGEMVSNIVSGTLMSMGCDVLDLGLSTTPTVEMEVVEQKAHGGIIITASHNPKQWNALKLLNSKGEFLSAEEGDIIIKLSKKQDYNYSEIENIGRYKKIDGAFERHIEKILKLQLVDTEIIKKSNFTVAFDSVNSTGGIVLPLLLKALGVQNIIPLYNTIDGNFQHNPEPLPENLTEISKMVTKQKANVGFVVDPDVDRLAIIMETGEMFGEEYTLVSIADYILQNTGGNTVSNLSSTIALKDITIEKKYSYSAAAVGEVNVVKKMKETNAIIGGEGNGGVIYPALHYGRDALVGIALFLTHLAKSKCKVSELKAKYPQYVISKNKITLSEKINVDEILQKIKTTFKDEDIIDIDGVKINVNTTKEWVHLRKSNTEPIIRIYAESTNIEKANKLIDKIKSIINNII